MANLYKNFLLSCLLPITALYASDLDDNKDNTSSSSSSSSYNEGTLSRLLPDELQLKIITFLPLEDRLSLLYISKKMHEFVDEATKWSHSLKIARFFADKDRKDFGACLIKSFKDGRHLIYAKMFESLLSLEKKGVVTDTMIKNISEKFENNPLNVFIILAHGSAFFTEGIDDNNCATIIEALVPLSQEQIFKFIKALKSYEEVFFEEDTMRNYNRAIIIKALAPLSEEQIFKGIKALESYEEVFFEKDTISNYHRAITIGALALLSEGQINEFADALRTHQNAFFTKYMLALYRVKIIKALAPLSAGQIGEFAKALSIHQDVLFTKYYDVSDCNRTLIIEALAPLSSEGQIDVIAGYQNTFFTEYMNDDNRAKIIKALAPLSAGQIDEFAKALSIYQNAFFTESMNDDNRADIIEALAPLSARQIDIIAIHQNTLLPEHIDGFFRPHIIRALTLLTEAQITALSDSLTTHQSIFFSEHIDTGYHADIIIDFVPLTQGQIDEFAKSILDHQLDGGSMILAISEFKKEKGL